MAILWRHNCCFKSTREREDEMVIDEKGGFAGESEGRELCWRGELVRQRDAVEHVALLILVR